MSKVYRFMKYRMAIWFSAMAFFLFLSKILGFNFVPMIEGVRFLDLGSTILNNVAVIVNFTIIVIVSKFTYNKPIEIPVNCINIHYVVNDVIKIMSSLPHEINIKLAKKR